MHKLWDEFSGGTLGSQPLFELFRLILPHLDTVRPQYRLKQKGLANMYVSILAISESSNDAQTLLNWKKPSSGFQRNEQGNFPEVVHSVIETRMKKPKDLPKRLTIGELNAALDKLAEVQSTDEKKAVLDDLTKKTTAREQRWILRVILKDMQIGMKEDSIFRELHPDAKELYASVCDLRSTCQQCVDPSFRLNDITICLFKPMKPRLAHARQLVDGRAQESVEEGSTAPSTSSTASGWCYTFCAMASTMAATAPNGTRATATTRRPTMRSAWRRS